MHGCLHQINFRYSPWNMSHVKGIRMTGMYLKTFANDLCNGPSIGNSNLHGFQIFQYILIYVKGVLGKPNYSHPLPIANKKKTIQRHYLGPH